LVYSTEVERSTALGRSTWMETAGYPHGGAMLDLRVYARDPSQLPAEWRADAAAKRAARSWMHYEETPPGALQPSRKSRSFRGSYLVSGLIYGLVNVRTDGRTIMCATMNDANRGWNVQSFPARF